MDLVKGEMDVRKFPIVGYFLRRQGSCARVTPDTKVSSCITGQLELNRAILVGWFDVSNEVYY